MRRVGAEPVGFLMASAPLSTGGRLVPPGIKMCQGIEPDRVGHFHSYPCVRSQVRGTEFQRPFSRQRFTQPEPKTETPYAATKPRLFVGKAPPLSNACPQEIVDVDDADRHALLHDEKRRNR